MSWLLFVDESGQDRRQSPYEVLAGIAVEDKVLWSLIRQLGDAEEHHFGVRRFRAFQDEAKAKKLLKRKSFRLARQMPDIPLKDRRILAQGAIEYGPTATREQLTALGQAKIGYCQHILDICRGWKCVAFASIIPNDLPRPSGNFLRKDYAFLFERFFHFLNARNTQDMGIVVFDELEKSQSHILIGQMEGYFIRTQKGRYRARRIIPEPLFVHSDLTTMIQVADIIAYIVSWGAELRFMEKSRRPELGPLVRSVLDLRYLHESPNGDRTWGFKVIRTLESTRKTP